MKRLSLGIFLVVALAGVVLASTSIAEANHSWGGYHWARTSNPFTLNLGDNVSSVWDPILAKTSSDWSKSTVLDTKIVAGLANPRNCRPTSGRVEVCDASYGNNGWLGLAQIWITGGTHITQGVVKLNDFYMNSAPYNTTAWRNFVSCQEVGHTLGLAHQDEDFYNADLLDNKGIASCMDYSADPSQNQQPNQGDYDQLLCIYDPASNGVTLTTATHSCTGTGHLDSTTTVGQAAPGGGAHGNFDDPSEWGKLVSGMARSGAGSVAVYERNLGNGNKVVTFVIWAD